MHWLDPDYLPEVAGTVDRFLLNTRGDADGVLLTDGTEIHFPPHLSDEVLEAVRSGDPITVRGVRPRSGDLVAAVMIVTSHGKRIVDQGPAKEDEERKNVRKYVPTAERKPMQVEGVIRRALHGPKGETRGALLEDGQLIRFPAREAKRITELLSAGAPVVVRGESLATAFGNVVEAREIGRSTDTLLRVKAKAPKHVPKRVPSQPKTTKDGKGDRRPSAD
jgi:hypothetical protein